MEPKCSRNVRLAVDADLPRIVEFLQRQKRDGTKDSFLCNLLQIRKAHARKELHVFVHPGNLSVVAYAFGGLVGDGILEVQNSYRNQGIGSEFVAHLMALALHANEFVMNVQCAPSSSIRFWERMGFEAYSDVAGATWATRSFESALIPMGGKVRQVVLELFPGDAEFCSSVEPVRRSEVDAVDIWGGLLMFPKRVVFSSMQYAESGSPVLRIVVQGIQICRKKMHVDFIAPGVQKCSAGCYLEFLDISSVVACKSLLKSH